MAETGMKLVKVRSINSSPIADIPPVAPVSVTPFLQSTLLNRPEIIFSYMLRITDQEQLARASADYFIFSITHHRDAEFWRHLKTRVNDAHRPIYFDFLTTNSAGTMELMHVLSRLKNSLFPTLTSDGHFQFHGEHALVLVNRLTDNIPFLVKRS